jgi:hypothetical protein
MIMVFLVIISGFQIATPHFHEWFKLKHVMTMSLIHYCVDSTREIVWTGGYSKITKEITQWSLIIYIFVLMIVAIGATLINIKSVNNRIESLIEIVEARPNELESRLV